MCPTRICSGEPQARSQAIDFVTTCLKFSSYDAVVPLCQPLIEIEGSVKPIVDFAKLKAAIENGSWLDFDLSPLFQEMRSVRLRGIGLSFGNELSQGLDPGKLPEMSAYRLTTQTVLPEQIVAGAKVTRPPIHFGNISIFGGSTAVAWNSGNSCYNASPLGTWRVKFSPRAVHSLRHEKPAKLLIEDLKIHVSAIALVSGA